MTPAEILALIDARAAVDAEFARLVDERNDTEIAAALNAGRTRPQSKMIGAGTIIAALATKENPRAGSDLLRALRAAAAADSLIDEGGIRLIDRGEWDIGLPATQGFLTEMVAGGKLPEAVVARLVALAPPVPDPIVAQAEVGRALNRRGQS